MITEDYVSFEIARLLKEKGFNEECRAFWKDWKGEIRLCSCNSAHMFDYCSNSMLKVYNGSNELNIAAPTLQMAMKWLREVHNLFIFISTWLRLKDGTVQYYYEIRNLKDEDFEPLEDFETLYDYTSEELNSFEKVAEAAIKYCLENLI